MELTTVWFVLIAVLWIGYLVLEGFDFGVGMLTAVLARDEKERRVLLNTIGPVWDGNEVWLIVAGGATFAAFPEWYATLFSGFYLPLFVILVALILRIVALEYRSKRPAMVWKRRCDVGILIGSVVPAVLWGVALANLVRGVPIDADKEFVGSVVDLLNPYALLGGLVTLTVFLVHGAVFVGLKTVGDIRERARALALRVGVVAAVLATVFVGWTAGRDGDAVVWAAGAVAVACFAAALAAASARREGWAFVGTALSIAAVVVMLFTALFPDVMVSSLDPAWSLTTTNAASTPYTLTIMTWVAAAFTPLVVGYQAWSYWVFRRRIGTHHIPDDVLAPTS
ncbi:MULTISPECIES: cytochrome d ubiquinol oxidase subunit II [unclassified Aeromicrobium]|uniref:cytochrome d ubiquinol oxidase subunit II n=1 Tax=unclassified Aeromicrobium TaxID=2633570 RepID=UPI0020980DA6|nr:MULTISPECIES: cytochrome d ubiquinol oxidase subunit II [unclassified Aeromicrobium]MCO7240927.1 cytochrome d ubiquinol oxidase subunit II [Aeromicrobium sp. CnD17-E]MDR6119859.1 cytochrome d ubiquinol oxidase subunit II [Aeromicrobium sp. SORGH_AS_0981]